MNERHFSETYKGIKITPNFLGMVQLQASSWQYTVCPKEFETGRLVPVPAGFKLFEAHIKTFAHCRSCV